jgi:hypothetical protein
MKIEYILPSRVSIIDESKKSLSLIELLEDILIHVNTEQEFSKVEIVSSLIISIIREFETKEIRSSIILDLKNPRGEINVLMKKLDFTILPMHKRTRLRFEQILLPFSVPGRYFLRATTEEGQCLEYALDFGTVLTK